MAWNLMENLKYTLGFCGNGEYTQLIHDIPRAISVYLIVLTLLTNKSYNSFIFFYNIASTFWMEYWKYDRFLHCVIQIWLGNLCSE